ncbi:MAG TPA: Calx-beta domain-containing protein [Tepidisphaeraceae bacterium]|nr:Calx-beta domain-containing protein [Tepidisphaeraceae bacterium]
MKASVILPRPNILYDIQVQVVGNGGGLSNIATATGVALTDQQTVSVIQSGIFVINEGGSPSSGTFVVRRSGPKAQIDRSLTVYYNTIGNAINGVDFSSLSGSVTFDPTVTEKTITIQSLDDQKATRHHVFGPTSGKLVYLSLLSGPGYQASDGNIYGVINDNDSEIDMDSDNNDGNRLPSRTDAEEQIEDDPTKPGKIISVNDDDTDGDGIPDFADGFSLYSDTSRLKQTVGEQFVPVVLQFPVVDSMTNPSNFKFRILYDASDPAQVTRSSDEQTYSLPAVGSMRLWTQDGDVSRVAQNFNTIGTADPNNPDTRGYYVAPNVGSGYYTYNDLAKWATLVGSKLEVRLWLEVVKPSTNPGDLRIEFDSDVDGDAATNFTDVDAVRLSGEESDLIDIDSDNNNGAATPDRSTDEDRLEDMSDSADRPGKLLQADDLDDTDGDGLPDIMDGFNYDGIIGNSDDAGGGQFVPIILSLPSLIDSNQALIRIIYEESSIANMQITEIPGAPATTAHGPAGIRLWNVNGAVSRNSASITNGGNYIAPDIYSAQDLGLAGGIHSIPLYVEAAGIDNNWGGSSIKVEIDPDGNGPAGFVLSDETKNTVVDTKMRVYAIQPYVVEDNHKVFYPMNYNSPQAMRDAGLFGFTHPDTDGQSSGWHGKDDWYGHAFVNLINRVPGTNVNEYYGATGQDQSQWLDTLVHGLWGDVPWFTFNGHRNTETELSQWIHNTNLIWSSWDPGTQTLGAAMPLVQQHTWIVKPSVARDLNQLLSPVDAGHPKGRDYSKYGLDVSSTQGGCVTLIGTVMAAVGFNEQVNWKIADRFAPRDITVDQSQWGPNDANHRLLNFFDTGLISSWMIANKGLWAITYHNQESIWNGRSVWS